MKLIMSAYVLSAVLGPAFAQPQQPDLATEQPSAVFSAGAADRQGWEAWIAGLSGDSKAGATYWAGQRSKRNPVPCLNSATGNSSEWIAGCVDARKRLLQIDIRRKSEPEYKVGWNSLPTTISPKTGEPAGQEPSPADVSSASFVPSSQGIAFLKSMTRDDIHYFWASGTTFDYSSFGMTGMNIEATKLFQDYNANEISADSKYLGKSFVVKGIILSISKNLFGNAYVELESGESFMKVQAQLSDDLLSEASRYQKGQQIELVCVGSGMLMGSPILSQCHSKAAIEAKAISRTETLIDEWFETGQIPTFITAAPDYNKKDLKNTFITDYNEKDQRKMFAFGIYWFGSRLPKNSLCLSNSLNLNACLAAVEPYLDSGNILKTLSDFGKNYTLASIKLKLPFVDWSDLIGKVRVGIAKHPAAFQKVIDTALAEVRKAKK